MNEARAREALHDLAEASSELASVCERDAPDFAATWRTVAANASVVERQFEPLQVKSELASLLAVVASLFSHHPGAFTEAYIVRASLDEQLAENAKFEALKDRVAAAAGALRKALDEE